MMFMIISFLFHPIKFIRGWKWSREHFDRDGNLIKQPDWSKR